MIRDLFVPVVTPMTDAGTIDVPALAAHCSWVCERGARGVMLFGTTGEGPSVSVAEKLTVTKQLIAAHPGLPIIGSVTETSLTDSVTLAQGYSDLPLTAVLVLPPGYFREPDTDGLQGFLHSVAGHTSHPVLAYHIPSLAPGVPPEVVDALGLAGAKDSSGDLGYTAAVLATGRVVMIGAEAVLPDALKMGASGAISGMANLMPAHLAGICAAVAAGDHSRARRLRDEVLAAQRLLTVAAPGMEWVAAMKVLAGRLHGTDLGGVRLPLVARRRYDEPDLVAALGADAA